MHEGKNIHYSQVDSKLLCSYSVKVCRQRRLNGYAFCNKHILEDPTAPFKRCVHISSRGKARCSNPIPQDRNTELCNIHQQKANANKEKEQQISNNKATATTTSLTPSTTTNTTTMSPPPYPPSNPNGLIMSHHTPPTTPTQDPQRLFIMDRLKNKFTRVPSCPSEDVIVNVVDDSDPYAFPDNDLEPVQTGSGQSEPAVESSQNQTAAVLQSGAGSHVTTTTTVVITSVKTSSAVTMGTSPMVMSVGGLAMNSLLLHHHHSSATTGAECDTTGSVMMMLPPTPPTGGTPIAKLYPELAGKLHHGFSSPAVAEKPASGGKGNNATSSTTGKGHHPHHHCMSVSDKAVAGGHSNNNHNSVVNSSNHSSHGSSSSGSRGKNSNVLNSAKANKSPNTGSRNSCTMNKLQSKIAQNRIKDKQKSKLKREESDSGSGGPSLSASGVGESTLLPVITIGGPPSSSSSSTADTTSTVFSLGSIPSLGNLLSSSSESTQDNNNINRLLIHQRPNGEGVGGQQPQPALVLQQHQQQRRRLLAPLSFPVTTALPVVVDHRRQHMTNSSGGSSNSHHHHVISSSSSPTVATVIPATVFTPFPNLACALSTLQGASSKKKTLSPSPQKPGKGKVKTKEASSAKTTKSGSSSISSRKKKTNTERVNNKTKGSGGVTNSRRKTTNIKTTKKSAMENDLCVIKQEIEDENDLHLGVGGEGLMTSSAVAAVKGLGRMKEGKKGGLKNRQAAGEKVDNSSSGGHINSSQIKENKCQNKLTSASSLSQKQQQGSINNNSSRPKSLELSKLNTVTGLLNQADFIKSRKGKQMLSVGGKELKTTPGALYSSAQNALLQCAGGDRYKRVIAGVKENTPLPPLLQEESYHMTTPAAGNNLKLLSLSSSNNSAPLIKVEDIKTEPLDTFFEEQHSRPGSGDVGLYCNNSSSTAAVDIKFQPQKVKRSLSIQLNKERRKNIVKIRQGSSSVIRPRSRFLRRKSRVILTEFEAKEVFRRKSSVSAYMCHVKNLKGSTPLLKFGVSSTSEDDSPQPLYSSWDPVCCPDDEEDQACDNLLDTQLLSTIRSTKISLVKSKIRRQLTHSKRLSRVSPSLNGSRNEATLELIKAARKDAKATSLVVRALSGDLKKVKKISESAESDQPMRTCLVQSNETGKICSKRALPFTNHCPAHIMYSVDQQLFDYCTAKFSNNTQCCRPVVDVTHELPLCAEHARKADNYQKSLKQPKKPRKKTKPSALTRPPKKGKKRKNQQQKRQTTGNSGMFAELDCQVKDEETDEMEFKPDIMEETEQVIPEMLCEVKVKVKEVKVEEVKVEEEDYTELEETFSPDTLDKTLELPLDMLEATKFLDKHDLGDMLNKLPDYAFDLFAATETAKPNDLTPTKEETELLEAAIAEASSSEFNFPSSQDQQPPELQQLGTTNHPATTSKTAGLDGLCLPVCIAKETLDKLAIEKISQEPPLDYMSDDNEAQEDELTKQIASSLMQRHLSDEEDVMDQDNINNLASSLTASDLNCISKALSGSDLEMNLNLNAPVPGHLGMQQQGVGATVLERHSHHLSLQQFQPQGLPPRTKPSPSGLVLNTNNNQGQSVGSTAIVRQAAAASRSNNKEEGAEIGNSQLTQILETFRSDQGSMDRLQQNIRQFLNNESPAASSSLMLSNSSTSTGGSHPGSSNHQSHHQHHSQQVQQQQQLQLQPQSAPVSATPSILQEFLTMGKQHPVASVGRVDSPGGYIANVESFPAALLRQSSNDSSYSSGSGTANGAYRFKHEPGQMTLIGGGGSTTSSSTPATSISAAGILTEVSPPNVSVTDIAPNVSVTDIPLSCQAKGPPNVTVTAIPASFQSSASQWPPSINSSAISIPSFSSIQAQLNMITSQLAAANNAAAAGSVVATSMTSPPPTPQKPNHPPKRTQTQKQKTPRSKKAKRSHAPQLTLDIAVANIAGQQQQQSGGSVASIQTDTTSGDLSNNATVAKLISLAAQYSAQPPVLGATTTTAPPVSFMGKSPSKALSTPPVQGYAPPRTPQQQQHTVFNSRVSFHPVPVESDSQLKGPPTQAAPLVADSIGKSWDSAKVLPVSANLTPTMPPVAIQTSTINIPTRSQVSQIRTSPSFIKGSSAKSQSQAHSPATQSLVVRGGPVFGNQSIVLPTGLTLSSPPVISTLNSNSKRPVAVVTCAAAAAGRSDQQQQQDLQQEQVAWQVALTQQSTQQQQQHRGNFTVSTSTQAFLASLLQDTSAKKQQVTPEQQRMLQQLQQSAISAIPAVPSSQNAHQQRQQTGANVQAGGIPPQAANTTSKVVSAHPGANISLQHLLQATAIHVPTAGDLPTTNNHHSHQTLPNAAIAKSTTTPGSKDKNPLGTASSSHNNPLGHPSTTITQQPLPSPSPVITPNVSVQNANLIMPGYHPVNQVSSNKSPVYFHGTMLPPLRSSPRQQPPLPRMSVTNTKLTCTQTLISHTKPTLMASSMQSVRIPVSTDIQNNICMLNPLLSDIIQQASLNNANLSSQKVTSQGISTMGLALSASMTNSVSLAGLSSISSQVTGVLGGSGSGVITTFSSSPIKPESQGTMNSLSLPGVLTTGNAKRGTTTMPSNPLLVKNLPSPMKADLATLPQLQLSSPTIFSSQPGFVGPRPQMGTCTNTATAGIYQLPTNQLLQSPSAKSQLMPNLPPPIVSTTIAGQKKVSMHHTSSEILPSIHSAFSSQLQPSIATTSHHHHHPNVAMGIAGSTTAHDLQLSSIKQSGMLQQATPPCHYNRSGSTTTTLPDGTYSSATHHNNSSSSTMYSNSSIFASTIFASSPIVSPAAGGGTTSAARTIIAVPSVATKMSTNSSSSGNPIAIVRPSSSLSSCSLPMSNNNPPHGLVQTPSSASLSSMAALTELPPGFLQNLGALPPNVASLPQIAAQIAALQAQAATLSSSGGQVAAMGLKLDTYPLARPPGILTTGLTNLISSTQATVSATGVTIGGGGLGSHQQQQLLQPPPQQLPRQPFLMAQLPSTKTSSIQDSSKQDAVGIDKA